MVYQHFTLVPCLTGAENLVISRADAPAVIDWNKEKAALEAFLDRMPFRAPLDQPVSTLAAGEKQKLEMLRCEIELLRRKLDALTREAEEAAAPEAAPAIKDNAA